MKHISAILLGLLLCGLCSAEVSAEEVALQSTNSVIEEPSAGFDELSLEQLLDVVVTASKKEENLADSAAIISVISREDIDSWGYDSLAEILKHVTGFYVADDHMLPNIAINGVSGGQRAESSILKVLVDGRSVAFRSNSGNWLGTELIPVSAIERIEIVRGPSSAIYGADAFLGVINIITINAKKRSRGDLRISANAIGASIGADQDISIAAQNAAFEILFASKFHREDRSHLSIPDSSPKAKLPDYAELADKAQDQDRNTGTGLLKLGYHFDPQTALVLTIYSSVVDSGGNFADWLQLANGTDDKGRWSENRLSLAHGHVNLHANTKVWDQLDLALDAGYFGGSVTPRDRIEIGSGAFWIQRDFGYQGLDIDATANWTINENWTLMTGLNLVYDDENLISLLRVNKNNSSEGPAGTVSEDNSLRQGHVQFLNPAAVAQIKWQPWGNKLNLTTGIRYDFHNIYGHQFSVRLAAVSEIFRGFHLKFITANAFKAPTAMQLYALPYRVGDVIGNPDLQAQRTGSFALQTLYQLPKHFNLSFIANYFIVFRMVEFSPMGLNQIARNSADLSVLSLQSELSYQHRGLRGYFSVGTTQSQRVNNEHNYRSQRIGDQTGLYPQLMGHLGLSYLFPFAPLRAGVQVSAFSKRLSNPSNTLESGHIYSLASYHLIDLQLSTPGMHLFNESSDSVFSLAVRNLLNTQAVDPGYAGLDWPVLGRSVMLQFRQEI